MLFRAEQRDADLAQQVIEGTHVEARVHWTVRKHHVQLVHGQVGQQLAELALVTSHPHGLRAAPGLGDAARLNSRKPISVCARNFIFCLICVIDST